MGSLAALVTPLNPSGNVDWPALCRLVSFHLDNGTEGLVILGTTGEAATLALFERKHIIERVVATVAGQVPVIVGTGTNDTQESVQRTLQARKLGADACLLVTPYYNNPPERGLYEHYRFIAERANIPQILYNVPSRTGCDLRPETVAKLAQFESIAGIKDATGSLKRYHALRQQCGPNFKIFNGDDPTAMAWALEGADGVISVTANIDPQRMAQMMKACRENHEQAHALNAELSPIYDACSITTNPIPVKWLLHRLGFIHSNVRLPLVPLTEAEQAALEPVVCMIREKSAKND